MPVLANVKSDTSTPVTFSENASENWTLVAAEGFAFRRLIAVTVGGVVSLPLTVTGLPNKSATTCTAGTPAAQSSSAPRL